MACMTCGTAVSGVKSSPSLDTKSQQVVTEILETVEISSHDVFPLHLNSFRSEKLLNMQGVMERGSDKKCQLMVICNGADAVVKCSPCMHTIACRGCLLASVTLLKNCTVCNGMIEHFKFGSQGLAP